MEFIFSHEWNDHAAPIYSIAPFENDTFITGGADKIAATWNLEQKANLPFHIKADFGIYNLCFEPKSNLLFISQSKGGVHVIDTLQKKEIAHLLGHKKGVYKTLINDDANQIVCLGGDGFCSIWDLNTFKHIKTIAISSGKLRDAFINDNQLWLVCGDGNLTLLDLIDLSAKQKIHVADEALYTLLPHPINENIILCAGKDALIYAVNVATNQRFNFPAHNFGIYKLITIANTNLIASCSRDKSIKLWDVRDYSFQQKLTREQRNGHSASVNNMLYDPLSNTLISVGDDKRIIAWKAT
jgi:WD repeat-containing protein 61